MNRKIITLLALTLAGACAAAQADFKYTEQSKMTGGALASAMKVMGVFSKKAREPLRSTVYVKGNRMRREDAEGKVEIIDLDGRRIISIEPQKQTYSILTFDQMRQAIEQAKAKAQAQEAKQAKNPNVKITPKVQVVPGAGRQVLLGQNTREVKINVQMEMQSDDAQAQRQTATFWMNSDEYVAPSVPGYQEMLDFNVKLAQQLDWLPGEVFGGNVQISSARAEAAKNASELKGFPLLQYSSFGTAGAGAGQPGAQGQSQTQQPASHSTSVNPLNPGGMAVKALGGMFGRHKKKSQEQSAESGQAPAPPPSEPGSLLDMTIEVTSYSNDALDSSLFEVPAGYRQIEANTNRIVP